MRTMRKTILLTLILLLALTGTGWATLPASQTFTGAADTNPIGGSWTTITGDSDMQILSNVAVGTSGVSGAIWTADAFANDQSCTIVYNGGECGQGVRLNNTGPTGWILDINAGTINFYYSIGSGFTLATGYSIVYSPVSGDAVTLSIEGNPGTLTVSVNGTPIGTCPGVAGITAGQPGMWCYGSVGGIRSWTANSLNVFEVTTQAVTPSSITKTKATGNGNIVQLGLSPLAWGVCVNMTGNPTVADTVFGGSGSGGLGAFTAAMNGLNQSTKYYLRTFVTDSNGTVYGSQVTFGTPPYTYNFDSTLTDDSGGAPVLGDDNSCATPYKTIDALNYLLATGAIHGSDHTKFKRSATPGQQVFRGQIHLYAASGSAGNPITFETTGTGYQPELNASVLLPTTGNSWTPDNPVTGVYSTPGSGASLLWENGIALPQAASSSCTPGTWFFASNTIYYNPSLGTTFATNVVEEGNQASTVFTAYDNSLPGGNHYITFDGLYFSRLGIVADAATNGINMSNWTVKNSTFKHIGVTFTQAYSFTWLNLLIQGCTFDHCLKCSIKLEGQPDDGHTFNNLQVLGNTVKYNNTLESTGLEWYNANFDHSADNDCIAIQDMLNSTISGNDLSGYCTRNGGITYYIGAVHSTGNTISKNYIHDLIGDNTDNLMGAIRLFGGVDYPSNIAITTNIIARCVGNGLSLNSAQLSSPKSLVANNTITACDVPIDLENGTNFRIANNIIYLPNGTTFVFYYDPSHIGASNEFDYNCYYNPGSSAFVYPGGTKSFAGWQGDGYDTHGIKADPLFTNAGGFAQPEDFQVPWSSPASAGVNVGLTTDYWGNPVPTGGKYFMGVYQPAAIAAISSTMMF